MRLVVTQDLQTFMSVLTQFQYPHRWPLEFMAACAKALAFSANGDEIVGAAFYHWGPIPGQIYCHMALKEGIKPTPNVVGDFHKIPELMGGSQLRVAREAVTHQIIDLAVRSGWEDDGDELFIDLNPCRWTRYGHPLTERRKEVAA